jgi:hypothetical protein
MNSKSQWDAHVIGGKHMRAVTMNQPLAVDMSAASINSIYIVCFDTSIQYVHFFYIVVLPNGNFKCKSCDDFECSGHIPFEQHLTGKKHLKNVQRGKESTQFNTAVKSPLYGQRQPTGPLVHSPPAMNSGSLPIALADVSSACKVLFTPHKSPEKNCISCNIYLLYFQCCNLMDHTNVKFVLTLLAQALYPCRII